MKMRHEMLWLLTIIAMITLIDFYLGREFTQGFCFGAIFAAVVTFWEAGRAKK